MQSLILFLKGFLIGIGKIIPGVSGSLLAISLGVYQKAMEAINSFFHQKRQSLGYLLPLGIGVLLAILLGSRIILYFLNSYYVYTVMFFVGLIAGTVPSILKEHTFQFKDFLIIALLVSFLYFGQNYFILQKFQPDGSILSFLFIMFLGFLDAVTTVLPGISGTATFMMIGSYEFVLELFSNPFSQLFYCILFGIGLFIGLVLMVRLVSFCFRKYEHQTWVIILGFLFSAILMLFLNLIDFIRSSNLFSVTLLFVIGFQVISFFEK